MTTKTKLPHNLESKAINDNVTPLNGSRTNIWGVCPTCRRTDGCHSLGPDHWYVCDTHKVKWMVGSDLFSSWRDLTPEQRFANANKLAGYRKVEPFDPRKHGTAAEIASYHAGVAEVERIAAQAGFTVEITHWREVIDPLDQRELRASNSRHPLDPDDDELPF